MFRSLSATWPLAPVVLSFACSILTSVANAQQAPARPNVLLIAVDDLNDWLGCYKGHPNAMTPNMDRLARRSTVFTNAHCQAPICGPSRASLFTGLLPTTSGIYGQISDKQIKQASDSAAAAVFFPDYLEQHGYKTLACGKLFHNGDKAKCFQQYGGQASFGPKPKQRFQYDPAWFPEKIGNTQTDWGAFPETDDLMPDYRIADFGVKQLQAEHFEPFLLAVGFMRPHVPWYVPQKWFDMHPLDGIQLPPYLENDFDDIPEMSRRVNELPAMPSTTWAIKENQWKRIVQSYLACTTFVDVQIGKVLNALDASPYRDNTIVILFSDHGYHIGEKNRFAKQALWDRATRVPSLVSLPGQTESRRSGAPVGLIDLYPTILDLSGLPANPANDGASLRRLLHDDAQPWPHVSITSYGPNNHAVQTDRYRFYQYEDGSMELYDHQEDPNEWHNLAGQQGHHAMVKRLQDRLPSQPAASSKLNKYPVNEYFRRAFP